MHGFVTLIGLAVIGSLLCVLICIGILLRQAGRRQRPHAPGP